jgi:hypothetical protein
MRTVRPVLKTLPAQRALIVKTTYVWNVSETAIASQEKWAKESSYALLILEAL